MKLGACSSLTNRDDVYRFHGPVWYIFRTRLPSFNRELFCCRYSERSLTKCVGITIETRPDYCLKRHLSDMLSYGCTRLEIGVQSVYEDVARDTNRWEGAFSAHCMLFGSKP